MQSPKWFSSGSLALLSGKRLLCIGGFCGMDNYDALVFISTASLPDLAVMLFVMMRKLNFAQNVSHFGGTCVLGT